MKIAIDARVLRTSTGRYVERLLHYLQEIDHENDYIILLAPKDFEGWTPTNPKFTKRILNVRNYSWREQTSYALLLRRLGVDLVHFAMPQQPLLYNRPSVTTVHDLTLLHFKNYEDNSKLAYDIKQSIFRFVLRWAIYKSRLVLAPTNYTKQDIVKTFHVNPEKIRITYEAAEPAAKNATSAVPALASKPFIMYVGRMDPYKNIRRLIEAHQALTKAMPDLQLVLPGAKDGNVAVLEQWVEGEKYKNIHFLGFIPDEQLAWLYQHTKAYVFPSLSEGFGLPGLEAMSYGAPLVSSNATCLPEVYQNAAHYFDPADTDDMAEKINDVLQDKILRTNLIREGSRVVFQYSWKHLAEETLAAYKTAVQK